MHAIRVDANTAVKWLDSNLMMVVLFFVHQGNSCFKSKENHCNISNSKRYKIWYIGPQSCTLEVSEILSKMFSFSKTIINLL